MKILVFPRIVRRSHDGEEINTESFNTLTLRPRREPHHMNTITEPHNVNTQNVLHHVNTINEQAQIEISQEPINQLNSISQPTFVRRDPFRIYSEEEETEAESIEMATILNESTPRLELPLRILQIQRIQTQRHEIRRQEFQRQHLQLLELQQQQQQQLQQIQEHIQQQQIPPPQRLSQEEQTPVNPRTMIRNLYIRTTVFENQLIFYIPAEILREQIEHVNRTIQFQISLTPASLYVTTIPPLPNEASTTAMELAEITIRRATPQSHHDTIWRQMENMVRPESSDED